MSSLSSAKASSAPSSFSSPGSAARQPALTMTQPAKLATMSTHLQTPQVSSFKHALLGQPGSSSNLAAPAQRLPSVWEKDEVKRIVKGK